MKDKKCVVVIRVEGDTLTSGESKALGLQFGSKMFDIVASMGKGTREFAIPVIVPEEPTLQAELEHDEGLLHRAASIYDRARR